MPWAHSFAAIYPPARFDGAGAWASVEVEGSADGLDWSSVYTQNIAVDVDPVTVEPLAFTVVCDLESGYFRFVFVDADDNRSPYSVGVYSPGMPTEPMLVTDPDLVPTLADVAALAYARTFVSNVARGTFDNDTYPDAAGVQTLCELAATDLHSFIGDPVPDALLPEARQVAAYRAAALLEASYFSDVNAEVGTPQSTYTAIYLEARVRLRDKIRADGRLWVA
jgi:hypothetical protein